MPAPPERSVCSGARPTFDHGVDGLEMARVRHDRDLDLARRRDPRPRRGQVVLHVARPALRVGDDGVEVRSPSNSRRIDSYGRPTVWASALRPATMRHADHDLVGAVLGRQFDREVQHRDEHVEAFERELLLPDVGTAEVLLERLRLGQALEQGAAPPRTASPEIGRTRSPA